MGIHSEFKYGIKLHSFSFSYSNLFIENEGIESEKPVQNLNYLASISREIFNFRNAGTMKKRNKLMPSWAFTCL